jgi:hypothetical protein
MKDARSQVTTWGAGPAGDAGIAGDRNHLIEEPHPWASGAKAWARPLTATAPAVANAIYDAVGVWIDELPITADKILRALHEEKIKG